MTTKTPNAETLEHLTAAERAAAEAATKAQAAATAAAAKAQAARDRAEAARTDASRRYALQVRGANKERRPALLQAIAEAKAAFAEDVLEGRAFGPAFLKIAEAEAALYVWELSYAEALSQLGQSPLRWPEPRAVDLTKALSDVLQAEASRLTTEAVEAMRAERQRWVNQQVAGNAPAADGKDVA